MYKKNCPYQIVKSERHEIGRVTVMQDTLSIDGEDFTYTYVINQDSVTVLAVYDGNVVTIEQYRHTLDRWMMELPAGSIDENETSEQAAKRELREETGFIAERVEFLGAYFVNQGISSARSDLYFAECKERVRPVREKTEIIRTRLIPFAQFEQLVDSNDFNLMLGVIGWIQAKKRGLL